MRALHGKGSFFVCGLRDGDFTSLTDEQFKRYEKLYHDPIIFTDTPLGIYPMKATPEERIRSFMLCRPSVSFSAVSAQIRSQFSSFRIRSQSK